MLFRSVYGQTYDVEDERFGRVLCSLALLGLMYTFQSLAQTISLPGNECIYCTLIDRTAQAPNLGIVFLSSVKSLLSPKKRKKYPPPHSMALRREKADN